VPQSAVRYLHDVLGLEWVPARDRGTTKVEIVAPNDCKLMVVVGQPFTPHDEQLLSRMMQAIDVPKYTVTNQLGDEPGVALILDLEVAIGRGLKTLGETKVDGPCRMILSHGLTELRIGSATEIQSRKRTAWLHLQQVQAWLREFA
jgi:hypothetical protein